MKSITLEEIRTWPVTVDLPTAGEVIGISRSYSYALAERGEFPCRVIRVGSRYRVPTAGIVALLEGQAAEADRAASLPPTG